MQNMHNMHNMQNMQNMQNIRLTIADIDMQDSRRNARAVQML